ncbi:MAG: exo-beta-N-acetylmuramidase NamZ family protein [Candidatus Kapaibacteriota bacterium]|jgi:uncharacterized protein YbbC (DUF1343 family)
MARYLLCLVIVSYFCQTLVFTKEFAQSKILLGIDVLIKDDFKILNGKKVGLLTNSASRSSTKKMTVEYFVNNPKFTLSAIFTPEHGFFTTVPAGKMVPDDSLYGVPIFSLYGNNRKPTPFQMSLVDVVVVDLQDIGVRSYTFISTLYKVMEACADANVPLIVLDRPNPLGGNIVDGNVVEPKWTSFVGIIPVPYIHGCTIGEIAMMINEEGWLKSNGNARKCDLTIVKMENWKRQMVWEDTGLEWFQTSPNIKNPGAIRGIAMFGVLGELHLFNLGVGTDKPFQVFSIKGVNSSKLEHIISNLKFDGVFFIKKSRPGKHSHFQVRFDIGKECKYYSCGMRLLFELRKHFPHLFSKEKLKPYSIEMFKKVTGNDILFQSLIEGSENLFMNNLNKGVDYFLKLRSKYLLYK